MSARRRSCQKPARYPGASMTFGTTGARAATRRHSSYAAQRGSSGT